MRSVSGVLIAALLAAALPTAVEAQQTEIRISHQWRQNTDARDRAARVFAEEASKLEPSLKFRIYPNRSLISDPIAQFDALTNGSIEMAVYPLVYGVGKVPEFSITIMPGTVPSMDYAMKLKGTAFHKKLQEIAEANGIRVMTWWWTPGGFATKDRAITGPKSVEGLRMRAADPYMERVLQANGASIVSMPSTEIYPALQSGVLDGLMTSSESFVSMRIYEQTKHATAGGDYVLFMLLQPLVISKQAWDKLTPAQKNAMEKAATKSEEFFNGLQREASDKMVEQFKKAGNDVRGLSKQEYDAWVASAKEVAWPHFVANTKHGKELLELIQNPAKGS